MRRQVGLSVALVASLGAVLVAGFGNHGGRAAPADALAGLVNSAVTQANVQDTICRRGLLFGVQN